MIVVSDTGPLSYLVEIREAELLPKLFGRVIAPPAVVLELRHPGTPESVRQWIATPPPWLEVIAPTHADAALRLGPGETDAISLARELRADVLLIDERDGTKIARRLGLLTTGTLGVLDIAAEKGLVSLPAALSLLETTKFHRSRHLFDQLLARDQTRTKNTGQGGKESQPPE
jgi:predicted nucleic acid-binding protein